MNYFNVHAIEPKIRLGTNKDGGYVIADIPNAAYDCYVSAGVSNEESFSRDFLQKYTIPTADCYAFDGTIKRYPRRFTTNIQFVKKNISNENTEITCNLKEIAKKYKNIFLKMDIEGGEYTWINDMETELLQSFKQMVIEFHDVNTNKMSFIPCTNASQGRLDFKQRCFKKVVDTHYVVHAHGNNCSTATVIDDNLVPNILEITYVRKNLFSEQLPLNTINLPCELDKPNVATKPDYSLNFPPFRHSKS